MTWRRTHAGRSARRGLSEVRDIRCPRMNSWWSSTRTWCNPSRWDISVAAGRPGQRRQRFHAVHKIFPERIERVSSISECLWVPRLLRVVLGLVEVGLVSLVLRCEVLQRLM